MCGSAAAVTLCGSSPLSASLERGRGHGRGPHRGRPATDGPQFPRRVSRGALGWSGRSRRMRLRAGARVPRCPVVDVGECAGTCSRTRRHEKGLNWQIPVRVLTYRVRLITLVFNDSPRGDGEGFGDGSPRRVWVVIRRRLPRGRTACRCGRRPGSRAGTPEPDGGARCRARGEVGALPLERSREWGRRAASRGRPSAAPAAGRCSPRGGRRRAAG
jgi:hypothetical protein